MASDRDTLARLISDDGTPRLGTRRPAQRILDAGWRPAARKITDPAELDTLPIMSIALAYGVAHQAVPSERGGALEWLKPAGQRTYTSAELLAACRGAGVTVLYEPVDEDEGADRG